MAITLDGTTGITSPAETVTGQFSSGSTMGFKNRIINGAMVIDQRNAGASVTGLTGGAYFTDRWQTFQNYGTVTVQQSTTAPAGFINSFYTTVTATVSAAAGSIYAIAHCIEGLNVADLGYGTASASTVTLSFWVRSSVIGTYGVFLRNSAADRFYTTTFSISSINTWTNVSLTITGDTAGTWLTTNGIGLTLGVVLGAGSNRQGTANTWTGSANGPYTTSSQVDWMSNTGATFYITGVQLEKGSTATSFDYRPYGTELALCQRYYFRRNSTSSIDIFGTMCAYGASAVSGKVCDLPVTMRAIPTVTISSITHISAYNASQVGAAPFTTAGAFTSTKDSINQPNGLAGSSGLVAGYAIYTVFNSASAWIDASSEL